ncbi:pimeloyl-ACP methyl ester carboxylesterase [Anoxybacillus kamchatkensis]|uniref:alpha/beta fold hydrolase n=1 Tax=Anoxybacillus ayderensis TaxID=265546 RepID=UPI0015EB6EFF|nr:alpha/beta hydrolase [Anoxybacillus ayderensis]MBA2877213.1 pimeloyl-ACP methyl ester carboxylesterase [Anoxybacillus ayderensis]
MPYTSKGTFYVFQPCQHHEAPTVLLINGLGCDMTSWDDMLPLLTKQFHVIHYDFYGTGASLKDKVQTSLCWDMFIEEIEHILHCCNISSNVHLIGHGAGGLIALHFAKRHLYIQSVMLINTPLYVPSDMIEKEMNLRMSVNEYSELVDRITPLLCYPNTSTKMQRLKQMMISWPFRTYLEHFRFFCNEVGSDFLSFVSLNVPVCILAGEKDSLYPIGIQFSYTQLFKNGRFFIIPNASNLVMIDQPELTVQFIIHFISSIKEQSSSPYFLYNMRSSLQEDLQSILKKGNIEVYCIPSFKVIVNGKEIVGQWNRRKAKNIFLFIAYYQSVTREQIYEEFWPNIDIVSAQNQLRVSLAHIKHIFKENGISVDEVMLIDRKTISIRPLCYVDISDLEKSIETMKVEQCLELKEKMYISVSSHLDKYFFSDFYDNWVVMKKYDIEENICSIGEQLLERIISPKRRYDILKIMLKTGFVKENLINEFIYLSREFGRDGEMLEYIWS